MADNMFSRSVNLYYLSKLHKLLNQKYHFSAADLSADSLLEMFIQRLSQEGMLLF